MLGRFEERVLWELVHAGGRTTTPDLQEALVAKYGRGSPGAIYTTLHRLVEKRLVTFKKGEPLKERGGKARNYYQITSAGRSELSESRQATMELGTLGDLGLSKTGAWG